MVQKRHKPATTATTTVISKRNSDLLDMVLYIIGLGLGDERDITIRGLEAIKASSYVFLEHYTAILGVEKEKLEAFYGKTIQYADRECVEQHAHEAILQHALENEKKTNVAFLVVGDALAATTHSDFFLRAQQYGIEVKIIYNASIMNAVGVTGLQLYTFGQTISIPFFSQTPYWKPMSFYEKLIVNRRMNLHTLCLLDIKVKEQSIENTAKGVKVYEPPRFMTVNTAIHQVLECVDFYRTQFNSQPQTNETLSSILNKSASITSSFKDDEHISPNCRAFACVRVGRDDEQIVSGTLTELKQIKFGAPLHSLVICAPVLHYIEEEMFNYWHWDPEYRKKYDQAKLDAKAKEEQVLQDALDQQKKEKDERLKEWKARKEEEKQEAEKKRLEAEILRKQQAQVQNDDEEEEEVCDIEPL